MFAKSPNENIEVPITSEEVIVVSTQELPSSSELLSLLPTTVDLKYWIRFAIAYYKQGLIDDFETILNAALQSTTYDRQQTKQSLLSLLAFYSLDKLPSVSSGNEQRKQLLEEAHSRLAEAEVIDRNYQVMWIVRGMFFLERENYEQAEIQFQTVLSRWKDNVPSFCGMALSFMKRNEWKKALRFWQLALKIISNDPKYPLAIQCDVRMGIGTSFGQLGMIREARTAFLRVLDLDPNHATALILLSSISINTMRKPTTSQDDCREALAQGFQYAGKAYSAMRQQDQINPIVLTRLSDILFLHKEYEKSQKILQLIEDGCTQDPQLLAEIYYYKGRHHHLRSEYDAAQDKYARSLSYHSDFLLSKYALGQILIFRSQYSQAIEYFEFIRSKLKQDNYDISKMLAFLHGQLAETPIQTSASMPTREYEEARENCRQLYARALELFRSLFAFRSQDPEECGYLDTDLILMYARLLESSPLATPEKRKSALKLYHMAKEILTRSKKDVPAELLNNLGVLYHVTEDPETSKQFFIQALQVVQDDAKLSLIDKEALETTMLYNIGRCYEELRNDAEAEKFYNIVLKKQPMYYDSALRLGLIEQAKGQLEEAASHFTKVVEQSPDNVEAHILLGTLFLTMNQVRMAKRNFEKVLSSIDKFDLVSLLQLGNILLFSANRENKDKVLVEAWKLYDKVLQLDPRNPYAANGIAIALREKGCLEDAMRLFEQVRETDDKVPCFMVNYAHILTEIGQFKRAIPLYEKALYRFFEGKNLDLLVSTARAYYQLGKTARSAEHLQAAMKYLQLALHIFPKDKTLWFNLAIVLQDHTVVLSVERMDKIAVEQMREAVRLADLAIRNLTWLASTPSDQYDQHIASQRVSYTRMVKEKLEKRIDELIETQKDRQKRLAEMIQQKQTEEAEVQRKRAQEAEKKRAEMESVLKSYQSMNEKIREDLKLWEHIQTKAQRQQREDEDGFVVPPSDDYEENDADLADDHMHLQDEALEDQYYKEAVADAYTKQMKRGFDRISPSDHETTPLSESHSVKREHNNSDAATSSTAKRRKLKKKSGTNFNPPISAEFILDSDAELEELE